MRDALSAVTRIPVTKYGIIKPVKPVRCVAHTIKEPSQKQLVRQVVHNCAGMGISKEWE